MGSLEGCPVAVVSPGKDTNNHRPRTPTLRTQLEDKDAFVQQVLGHRYLSSTQVYCHLTKEQLLEAARAAGHCHPLVARGHGNVRLPD